jgi:lysophospholipase L1-like esterase
LGWGDSLAAYFDESKINVLNRARAGRSARTFLTEGLWDKLLAEMKTGDYVLIQFGHNDSMAHRALASASPEWAMKRGKAFTPTVGI